jgi:clan AA aspartic protease (TIGR02281 family)
VTEFGRCEAHSEAKACVECPGCSAALCSQCLQKSVFCGSCRKEKFHHQLFWALGLMIGITLVTSVGYSLSSRGLRQSKIYQVTQQSREALEKTPCDRAAGVELTRSLYLSGSYADAIRESDSFLQRCGHMDTIRQIKHQSHEAISQWTQAIEEMDKLIEQSPEDASYWGWRGMDYESLGQWEKAIENYEKALALQPNLGDVPMNLASAYEKVQKHCRAAEVLQALVARYPEVSNAEDIFSRVKLLSDQGSCPGGRSKTSDNKTVVLFRPGSKSISLTAKFNGKKTGEVLLDTGASYVSISAKTAAKLGIAWKRLQVVNLQTASGKTQGWMTTAPSIEVNGLKADNVPVVVLDDGMDSPSLLGLSFLSRFHYEINHKKGQLIIHSQAY